MFCQHPLYNSSPFSQHPMELGANLRGIPSIHHHSLQIPTEDHMWPQHPSAPVMCEGTPNNAKATPKGKQCKMHNLVESAMKKHN